MTEAIGIPINRNPSDDLVGKLRVFWKGQIKNDARNVELIEECYKFLSGNFEKLQRAYENSYEALKKASIAVDVQRIKRLIRFQQLLGFRNYKVEGKDVDLGFLVERFRHETDYGKGQETEIFDMYLGDPAEKPTSP